jgi:hypothetical protein|tara:strand:+ start:243 stop:434 length:192 start_codon:yes stop_codon:yes gene_type:complete
MSEPSAVERERINHINSLMADLHDSNNLIYEGLIDRDFDSISSVVDVQIARLVELKNSIKDEI